MVLHGEQRELAVPDSLDSSIIQIQVRRLESRCTRDTGLVANHSEAMVLRGDEHLIIPNVTHRVVTSSVAIRQLRSATPEGESHELMTETNSKGG